MGVAKRKSTAGAGARGRPVMLAGGCALALLVACSSPGTGSGSAGVNGERPAKRDASSADPIAENLQRELSETIRPLFGAYCFQCHGGARVRGGVRLNTIGTLADAWNAGQTLESVREMLRTKEMPPKGKAQPSEHERLILDQWLQAVVAYVPPDAAIDPGWFTIHRLNRVEYRLTMRDLLGIDPGEMDVAERLPRDDTGYGFDNNADVLTVSPLLIEQYLDAADRALTHALGEIVTIGDGPVPVARLHATQGGNTLPGGGVFLYSNGAAEGQVRAPAEGEYAIRISAWEDHGGDERAHLSLRIDGKEVRGFDVSAGKGEPQELEVRTRLLPGGHRIDAAFTNDYWKPGVEDRNLGVEAITFAGPLDEASTKRSPAWERIIGPFSSIADEDARAGAIVGTFAERAFRRPLESGEREALLDLYRSQRGAGLKFEAAIRVALEAVLTSPRFLYRSLNNPDSGDSSVTYRLDAYELASRLSYFLWSSMPDEELLARAADGSLLQDATLSGEVGRMLGDRKADAFIENFSGQWLQLRTLDTLAIDQTRFPDYTDQLKADLAREGMLLFADVVRSGAPVVTLLNAKYSFLNEDLARHYAVEGVTGPEFRRVEWPAGAHRGGILTLGGVLTVTSNTTRTSPVKRGLFVLDQILGTPPPPPPADIPPLEQAHTAKADATLRERLAVHVANPACAVCHNRLDPIGLSLENYDAVGRWRGDEDGKAIDASGTLPGGEHLNGPDDLRKVLVSREDQFIETLGAKILTYAIGRGPEAFDRPAVRAIANRTKERGRSLEALIESVVLSDTFRTCRGREARDE